MDVCFKFPQDVNYILMLVKKYHDTHCQDKEVLITIHKAIDASPELREFYCRNQ